MSTRYPSYDFILQWRDHVIPSQSEYTMTALTFNTNVIFAISAIISCYVQIWYKFQTKTKSEKQPISGTRIEDT